MSRQCSFDHDHVMLIASRGVPGRGCTIIIFPCMSVHVQLAIVYDNFIYRTDII